jgi:hypothetical protein
MLLEAEGVLREGIDVLLLTPLPYFEKVVLGNRVSPPANYKVAIVLQQRDVSAVLFIFAQIAQIGNFVNKPGLFVKNTLAVVLKAEPLANASLPLKFGQHLLQKVLRPDQIHLDRRLIPACGLFRFLPVVFKEVVKAFLALVVLADQLVHLLQIEHLHHLDQ